MWREADDEGEGQWHNAYTYDGGSVSMSTSGWPSGSSSSSSSSSTLTQRIALNELDVPGPSVGSAGGARRRAVGVRCSKLRLLLLALHGAPSADDGGGEEAKRKCGSEGFALNQILIQSPVPAVNLRSVLRDVEQWLLPLAGIHSASQAAGGSGGEECVLAAVALRRLALASGSLSAMLRVVLSLLPPAPADDDGNGAPKKKNTAKSRRAPSFFSDPRFALKPPAPEPQESKADVACGARASRTCRLLLLQVALLGPAIRPLVQTLVARPQCKRIAAPPQQLSPAQARVARPITHSALLAAHFAFGPRGVTRQAEREQKAAEGPLFDPAVQASSQQLVAELAAYTDQRATGRGGGRWPRTLVIGGASYYAVSVLRHGGADRDSKRQERKLFEFVRGAAKPLADSGRQAIVYVRDASKVAQLGKKLKRVGLWAPPGDCKARVASRRHANRTCGVANRQTQSARAVAWPTAPKRNARTKPSRALPLSRTTHLPFESSRVRACGRDARGVRVRCTYAPHSHPPNSRQQRATQRPPAAQHHRSHLTVPLGRP